MPSVNLVDDTFIAAAPAIVADAINQPQNWRTWWPRLTLSVYENRGVKGVRWTVTGELVGTGELWVEPHLDGAVLHFYLRADPIGSGRRAADRLRRSYTTNWKRHVWSLKDRLELQRLPGTPPAWSR